MRPELVPGAAMRSVEPLIRLKLSLWELLLLNDPPGPAVTRKLLAIDPGTRIRPLLLNAAPAPIASSPPATQLTVPELSRVRPMLMRVVPAGGVGRFSVLVAGMTMCP